MTSERPTVIRIAALIAMVATILALNQVGAFSWVAGKFVGFLIPKDDVKFAAAMSDHLMSTPKCAPFRAEMLEAGKGAHAGPGRIRIINAYNGALAAGCKKS